jgi:hypothetical protein
MTRWFTLSLFVAALLPTTARMSAADDVRHIKFAGVLIGTWGETAEMCAKNDKSNIKIDATTYGDAEGTCAVRWIVETPGSAGTNYAVHALCRSAIHPDMTQTVNIIIRPKGKDVADMGRSFESLKMFQRCASN